MISTNSRMRMMFTVGVFLVCLPGISRAAPKLLSVEKIWDQGKHNAFTDLIRWHGNWYCVFREAEAHVGGDGQIRVLASPDGQKWQSVALIEEEGIDLRDPKLSITPDDRLMIVAGGSVYKGTKTIMGRQPRVTFSNDGRNWTPTQRVLDEGEWLWRVTWHKGKAYGVSYNASMRGSKEAQDAAKSNQPAPPGPADWKLKLFVSADGVKYDLITHLDVAGHPNETTLRFLPDDTMIAMVRREGGNTRGWIGVSKPPYKEWQWHETKYRFGGPNFIVLPDGSMWAATRQYDAQRKTVVGPLTVKSFEPALELPSGGDTSYAGLVWHEGQLWVSYYSSHEGKSSIYLARARLE
ncbi:MAG: exo-alpha-sialidase [Gemmataceae bacterium]